MDKRDIALQQSCPVVCMPLYSPLVPLMQNGERIIVGKNGTFLEVRRPWVHTIVTVGPQLLTTVPFGVVDEKFELTAPQIPRELLTRFIDWSQQQSNVEIGAVITWNERTGQYLLRRSKSNHATAGSLDYELPTLTEGEHIVVDCHSHSHHNAYFSSVDDEDDRHQVKFAFVVGNCNTANPTTATRLCVRGHFKRIKLKV